MIGTKADNVYSRSKKKMDLSVLSRLKNSRSFWERGLRRGRFNDFMIPKVSTCSVPNSLRVSIVNSDVPFKLLVCVDLSLSYWSKRHQRPVMFHRTVRTVHIMSLQIITLSVPLFYTWTSINSHRRGTNVNTITFVLPTLTFVR